MRSPSVHAPCFTVLDTLGGLFALRKRSPTLDGAVPLRAAQACMPLLAGNELGFQVVLTRPLQLRRRLGGLTLADDAERAADAPPVATLHQAALAKILGAPRFPLSESWVRTLQQGLGWSSRRLVGGGGDRFWLWTGLFLKPDPGVWLRVMSAANRRHLTLQVSEQIFAAHDAWVPLVLQLQLGPGQRELALHGELACVVPFSPDLDCTTSPLESEPAVGRAHADFYDASYFAQKKQGSTRRYRRQVDTSGESAPPAQGPAVCQVIAAGPGTSSRQCGEHFASPVAFADNPRPTESSVARSVQFENLLPFTCTYDGYSLHVQYDRTKLAAQAELLWTRWRALYGQEFVESHKGALWYLSKYFTMHPPGEPYFFVKPWAFLRTPPGWSCVIEGVPGAGYDVLRGVIATDQFFALPAVFFVHTLHRALAVKEHTPLFRALPLPRRLLHAGYRVEKLPGEV